ncbi:MAG: hypothetical protein WBM44_09095 [Waterburya sp.]
MVTVKTIAPTWFNTAKCWQHVYPMGLPLLGATLPGNKTDESDYLPTWRQLAKIIGHLDFLLHAGIALCRGF